LTDVFTATTATPTGDTGNSEATTSNEGDQPTFEFIGEGRQYADQNAALSSIPHKDTHIARIEQENAEMRAKLAESKKLEDVLAAMNSSSNQAPDAQMNAPQGTQVENTTPQDMAEIVKSVLQEERDASKAESNVAAANKFMFDTFGDKAQEVATSKAAELGMSIDDLKGLALRSPVAYQALFKQNSTVDTGTRSSQGDVNTLAQTSTLTGKAKYDEIRRADARKFLSPEVQKAQMKAALENPDLYFG